MLQQTELWPQLTVREIHRIFAGYYQAPRDVDEVIEIVGLGGKRDARVKSLSGGQKRRLDLGVALAQAPRIAGILLVEVRRIQLGCDRRLLVFKSGDQLGKFLKLALLLVAQLYLFTRPALCGR